MPNPGPGGWGAVLIFERDGKQHTKELSGGAEDTTNNRMELTAALEALRTLKEPCQIAFYTDSQYLKNGITEWMAGWKATNFKKGKILNVDLWTALDAEVARHEISWHWVKGHSGNRYNELVDRLATAARPGGADPIATLAPVDYAAYLGVSCLGAPGTGAWGVVLDHQGMQSVLTGGHPRTNAQRLDLLAAIAALEAVPAGSSLRVFTGNSYLHDGITKWVAGWKRNQWQKKTGGEVVYRNLWQHLDKLAQRRTVQWVLFAENQRPTALDTLTVPLNEAIRQAKQMRQAPPEPEFEP